MSRTRSTTTPTWLPFVAGGPANDLQDVPPAWWGTAIAIAANGGVLEALTVRLRATGILATLPEVMREQLERCERQAALTTLANQRDFIQVAKALEAADVPVVPYKGIDLAHTVYPDMRMRPMTDVDLWVRAEQLPAALDALTAAGLVRKPSPVQRTPFPRAWDGEVKLRREENPRTVAELHHGPFPGEWLHRAAQIDRAAVWGRLRCGVLLDHHVLRLAPEDHALEVALHAAITHQYSYVPLRQLLDLVILARAGLEVEGLVARSSEWRVTRVARLAFALAGEAYGDPNAAVIARHLALAAPSAGPMRAWGQPTLTSVLASNHLSRTRIARYVYLLGLTHGWRDAVRLLAPGVWPARSWLLARYGSSGARARLRHLRVLLSRDRRGGRS